MSIAGLDAVPSHDSFASPTMITLHDLERSLVMQHARIGTTPAVPQGNGERRRTPRKSLIVVLPENHEVSPDRVTERMPAEGDNEEIDVILACAGQSASIAALQRRVRDLQVLLAPPGTSPEDLRVLAMNRAPGDIVTLLNGTPV
jgi:hypothetical protein